MERVSPAPGVLAAPLGVERRDETTRLEAVFRRYSSYVAAVAIRLLGRDDEVDDVVQEVFLVALRGLGRLREHEALKGWLATITVRIAGRRLRRRRLRGFFGLDRRPDYLEVASDEASPEERALLARVYRLLDELPVGERLAWTLRHVDGEPLDAVAQRCGCSLATAKRRIAAAQRKIEEALGG